MREYTYNLLASLGGRPPACRQRQALPLLGVLHQQRHGSCKLKDYEKK
jgi:hypothetical protein